MPALKLYPYQLEGVRHLTTPVRSATGIDRPHKLLADAPGLGKTVQACAALKKVNAKSALIITPAPHVVKNSWRKTLLKLEVCGQDDIQVINSSKQLVSSTAKFIIINYELLQNKQVYRDVYWSGPYDVIIVDEAQRLKSLDSKRSVSILGSSERLIERGWWKWFLTGTPMPNRPVELFPILSSMVPELLGEYRDWKRYIQRFCGAYYDARGWQYQGASNIPDLRERITPFMLRREVIEVFPDLAEPVESTMYIDLGDMVDDESNTQSATLRKTIGIAKIPYCVEYINYRVEQARADGEVPKFFCFTFHRPVSEGVHAGVPGSVLIYGGMSQKAKDAAIEAYTNGDAVALIAQVTSLGEAADGFQFVGNQIIDCEPEWSDGAYDQQAGRIRRIGQTKQVYRVSLIAENTQDESVVASREGKHRNVRELYYKEDKQMGLEQDISRIAAALEALVEQGKSGASGGSQPTQAENQTSKPAATNGNGAVKPPVEQPATKEVVEVVLTVDDIRAAGSETIVLLGETDANRARIQQVVKDNGGKTGKADSVPKKNIAACVAAIKALADEPAPQEVGAGI